MQSAWLDAVGALRPRTIAIAGCFAVKLVTLPIALHYQLTLVELVAALVAPDVLWQMAYFAVMPHATSATVRMLAGAYAVFLAVAVVVAAVVAVLSWQLGAWTALPTLVAQICAGGLLVLAAMIVAIGRGLLGVRTETFVSLPIVGRLVGGG